jgi:lipoprotein-releasing system permease protein
MLIVSLINMSSTLLVLILERTNMIGIIKSMGGTNKLLRNTFVWNGIFLIGKGLLIGNILGIGLALLQQYTGAIGLDQNTYFIDRVPIHLDALHLLLLNAGTLLICFVTLLLPAWFVARITPVKAIRFQ